MTPRVSALVNSGVSSTFRMSAPRRILLKSSLRLCALKPRCCPNTPARKIPRSLYEEARDKARDIAKTESYRTSRRKRKKVEMLFTHLKRILQLDRLRLRGPGGARDEFLLAGTAQNLRKLAKTISMPQPAMAA